jgi:hypothetical protein
MLTRGLIGGNDYLFDCRAAGGVGYLWYDTSFVLSHSSGTRYVNGIPSTSFQSRTVNTIILSGVTLTASILDIGRHNGGSSLINGNLLDFIVLARTLSFLQVADLHIQMMKGLNDV